MKKPWTTERYWDERVRTTPDRKRMIFVDPRFDEYERRTRELLSAWSSYKVLDVACGYGRFANHFQDRNYVGIDFSEEMLKLARENFKDKTFLKLNGKNCELIDTYDVIFEVNSLKSLDMTAEQFIERYSLYAKKYVACIEADEITIKQIYVD